ncbi:PREDICTED: uncharacterized protein LOC107352247 [Acropora digitifera]|uniref:uncharacterized protein LOC107352247 n=1 Tax=Acropora digitifera TaxID=70779 RepID=UPI00077A5AC8|nr:PREDICTED: uncharacterized protein LOC107352247 [Acropora digitifera]
MKKRFEIFEESNRLAAGRHLHEMVDKVKCALLLMESRLSAKLDGIEQRLALLEASSTQPTPMTSEFTLQSNSPDPDSAHEHLTADGIPNADLTTIDANALDRIRELFPVSPVVPLSPVVPPSEPPQPFLVRDSSTPVVEDLVRSCVTPRKVQRVQEALQSEEDRYKCTIKLLPKLFTPDELAMSNTEGNFGKQPLDKTKLHTLKVLIFTRFPVGPEEEENKCWRLVKCKINAKCRTKRFERTMREK